MEKQKQKEIEEDRVGSVFGTMFLFTALMFTMPLTGYYMSKSYVFEGYFGVENSSSSIYSAIVAVFIVHLIAGSYVYLAWQDAMEKPKED